MDLARLQDLRACVAQGPPYEAAWLEALQQDPRAGGQQLYQQCLRKTARIEAEAERLETMQSFERQAREIGFQRIAGVDEAGRGPLAGPVVAGAVVLAEPIAGLNDSKQLSESEREALFEALHAGGHAIGVGIVESTEIDHIGIQPANYAAMARAVADLPEPPDYLLVDGFALPGVTQPQLRIIKGDARSLSIAAASIIAKVTRDRIMVKLDREYSVYGFGTHKGYGTREHLDAIEKYGPCPAHRMSFAPMRTAPEQQSLF